MVILKQTDVIFILLSLQSYLALAKPVGSDIGYFWHISDIHYDYSWRDEVTAESCIKTPPADERGPFGHPQCDSPWALVNSSVWAMQRLYPSADFIIWTGDNTFHDLSGKVLNRVSGLDSLQNITNLFNVVFPATPLYASLGNHEPIPKNKFPPGPSYIYKETWNMWKKYIPANQKSVYHKGGYYRIDHSENFVILVLNTNLYLVFYKDNKNLTDPGNQFDWLTQELGKIKKTNKKAILVGHTGPGLRTRPNAREHWHMHHQKKFISVIQKYSDVISAVHVGHDHYDHFRIIYSNDKPVTPIFFTLSVTPWMGGYDRRNPGIRLIKYNRKTGLQIDFIQYYLDIKQANMAREDNWSKLYEMKKEYKLNDLGASSLHKVVNNFHRDDKLFERYFSLSLGFRKTKTTYNEKLKKDEICCMYNFDLESYKKCLKGSGSSKERNFSISLIFMMTLIYVFTK